VPVPLHRRRLAQRGYNQAGLLAREWGRRLGLPVRPGALRRTRATAAQAELPGRERRRNVAGAFRARGVTGRPVVLVDDVVTSGATVEAAAEALLAAGATEVRVLAVARAGLGRSP
jgi:ComF family protein